MGAGTYRTFEQPAEDVLILRPPKKAATAEETTMTECEADADDIRRAAEAIKGQVVRTPFVSAPRLAKQLGLASLRLKLENQQFTGSFKDRGASYKLRSLSPEEAKRGVIAMSAGNHAQGVAYHAQRLGIPATIVMPEGTPFTKIERTAGFGPRVILKGDSIDAAAVYARELAAAENLVFVHPYDDPYIVAGQGTIGLEIIEDDPDLDFLVIRSAAAA